MFLPTISDLTEQQGQLLWTVLAFLRGYRDDGLLRTSDADVQDMAEALASTFETAAKGLIYEHRPGSLAAQRLAAEIRPFLSRLAENGAPSDRDLAAVFRSIAAGARDARKALPGDDTAYLELVRRMIVPSATTPGLAREAGGAEATGSLLIRP